MSYYDYLNEQYGKDHRLSDEFLQSKAITVSTKMVNYHDVKVKRTTDKSILMELKHDDGETFVAWASKSIMTVYNGEAGRLFIRMPDWFRFKAIL